MKAICITNRNHDTPEKNGRNAILTIGKIYDITLAGSGAGWWHFEDYLVTSDAGRDITVPKYYFKLIDEYRQEQIKKILE
jgi:hypothetical protein